MSTAGMNSQAERLKEAAGKLRDLAEKATPAPWSPFDQHGRDYTDEGYSIIGVKSGEIDVALTHPTGFEHERHEADAAFIAALSPDVAKALADWLDEEGRPGRSVFPSVRAQIVADRILGTAS